MCKNPIMIKTRSRYLTQGHAQQLQMWVNCGHCSECREAKQREWNVRTYYEMLKCFNNQGWVYFDTLTYKNDKLPRLTNYIDKCKNWACFNPKDIRYFLETLRQKLKNQKFIKKDNELGYFIVSEYGELRHRPHYHIMLFVNFNIDKIYMSKLVSESWKFGRTDGTPYKTKRYILEHNCIEKINLNAMRYIAKYVTKQQTFIEIINKRWNELLKFYEKSKYTKLQIKKIKAQYFRMTTPFHRQNQQFGETALEYCNGYSGNIFYKDDSIKRIANCGLPTYFRRKLTQQQIKVDGKRIWVNTDKGAEWAKKREEEQLNRTKLSIQARGLTKGIIIDDKQAETLAHYVLLRRGRDDGEENYQSHVDEAVAYNYSSNKDLYYIGKRTISATNAGNDTIGYQPSNLQPIDWDNGYINEEYEAILAKINSTAEEAQTDKEHVLHNEKMRELKKVYFNQ